VDRDQTVDALELILDLAAERGLAAVTVRELLERSDRAAATPATTGLTGLPTPPG
jgi:hypothetical protein